MLVLTRRKNESIIIDENIEITIVAIEGDQIKLGIQAPKDIDIHRKEVYLQIQTENNEATQNPVDIMNLLKNNHMK